MNTVKYNIDQEIMNSLISVFHPFANTCLHLVTILLSTMHYRVLMLGHKNVYYYIKMLLNILLL
jgi:hypothetical protein